MKAVVATLAGVLVVSGFVVSAAGPGTAPPVGVAIEAPQDAAKIEAGKKVYEAQKCAACHMIAGKGSKLSPLDGVGAKLSVEDIRKWIVEPATMEAKLATKPKIKMKAYKMGDADLDALVAYMASIKK
jgi:mono/diheme cytochrome c family protein